MKKKKAFITGINGQDGSYLSELLLEKGYDVYGIVRRNSVPENQSNRLENFDDRLNIEYGDVLDQSCLSRNLNLIKPDEIYNLAAQSHVRISFDIPQFTVQTNALGVLNILEAFRLNCPKAKFYQASSSEMFGNSVDEDGFQRETTPFKPVSPYGCAKVFGFNISRNYRKSYKLHIVNGILFNHESPVRGETFVTRKIIRGLIRIRNGYQDRLFLGNLHSKRDWGHAKDYVEAMWRMLQQKKPNDFVIATGKTFTIKEFVNKAAKKIGFKIKWIGKGINEKAINIENQKILIECKKRYFRPVEVDYLKGNANKARKLLKWSPKISIDDMISEMIDHESEYLS